MQILESEAKTPSEQCFHQCWHFVAASLALGLVIEREDTLHPQVIYVERSPDPLLPNRLLTEAAEKGYN